MIDNNKLLVQTKIVKEYLEDLFGTPFACAPNTVSAKGMEYIC